MKHYTPKQVNLIKQEIRTGKPPKLIAQDLSKEWGKTFQGLYTKVLLLSKKTYKINNTWKESQKKAIIAPVKAPRPAVVQETIDFTPLQGGVLDTFTLDEKEVITDICNEIIETPAFEDSHENVETVEQLPAQIEVEGIEVPASHITFVGTPSRVVIYKDHVRYYYSNENN
jgi:hypothetical protein